MMATTGIEYATLIVAGLAVVASVYGIIYNAGAAKRSAHHVWQRDMRVRLYKEFLDAAEEVYVLLVKYAKYCGPDSGEEGNRAPQNLDAQIALRKALTSLLDKDREVNIFGSRDIRIAGLDLRSACVQAMESSFNDDAPESDRTWDRRIWFGSKLGTFQVVVRKSLGITED